MTWHDMNNFIYNRGSLRNIINAYNVCLYLGSVSNPGRKDNLLYPSPNFTQIIKFSL